MTRPLYGIGLAAAGALILTPDALFMRISGMDGAQMLGWRGLSVATVYLIAWLLLDKDRAALPRLGTRAGLTLVISQSCNAALFPLGIALAPVAIMLLAVATSPIWAALLSRVLYGERTRPATWIAMAAVLTGIAIAVTETGTAALSTGALLGALCGMGVAACLALTFTTLRHNPGLPLLPGLGAGAALAGLVGLLITGPAQMMQGNVPAILLTGIVITPVSFFMLSLASRHTHAANVSLLMLLETVLAPIWVWLALDEAPTGRMLAGGAIVILSLAAYILATRARRRAAPPLHLAE